MGLLQDKLAKYDEPQKYMAEGIYPYFREIEGKQGTEVLMGGHRVLMFGSNAYTGLTGDDRVIEAGVAAMRKYGSGCAGSRFLNGTLDIHVQLEKELAAFVGKEEALCFATGFTVNSGVIPCLTGRGDYIICDDRDHASIVDGKRLSFSQNLKYKHNDMADLEKQLQKCNPDAIKLIIVDGVFSMEGDLANLPEIVRLKHKYNASIMVDEAHGLGVFGKQGRGVCDYFGLTNEVDLIMGTFSKSLASIGGFIDGILDGTIPKEKANYYLEIVSGEIKRLTRLVVTMLNMSKIESGSFEMKPQKYDISDQIIHILLTFEQKIEEKHIEIEGLENLNPTFITADRDMIYQVIYNIFDNAVKFTNEGGYINVSMNEDDKNVEVHIKNSGIGIQKEELSKVFQRFYKVDKSRGLDAKGAGLGLYIVKMMVEMHSGTIYAQSEDENTAEFVFKLPKEYKPVYKKGDKQ